MLRTLKSKGRITVLLGAILGLFFSCAKPGPVMVVPTPVTAPRFEQISKEGLKIKILDDKRELPIGYWTQGKLGDYLLENDKIRIVINNIDRPISQAKSGGNIIDVAKIDDRLDYLGQLYATYNPKNYSYYQFTSAYTKAEGYENGAALIVEGQATVNRQVKFRNEYIIEPGVNYLRIVSTVENNTTSTLKVSLGDTVDWGGCRSFIGRHGVPPMNRQLETESEWLCGYVYNYSVGLMVKSGLVNGTHYLNVSDLVYEKTTVEPGQAVSYERYLVVADRNISSISDFAWQLRGEPQGYITGQVLEMPDRKPLADVDVQVRCSILKGERVEPYPYTRCYSDETGSFRMAVQEGRYFVRPAPFGRQTPRQALSIDVPPGGTHVINLQVSPPLSFKFRAVDAITGQLLPCKLTFISIPETEMVDFGPPYELPGSHNTYYSATGEGELIVPSGKYLIAVSRGVEYDVFEKEMTIGFGRENYLEAKLERVIDTSGYISADMGVRSSNSYDSLVSPKDRVIAAVAEGVEYLVSADSDTTTDYNPIIEQLNLTSFINAGIGKQIDFWRGDGLGNFLVFPVAKEPGAAEAIPEETQVSSGQQLLKLLRQKYPGALIQVNRPLSDEEGYFQKHGIDVETGELGKPEGFSFDFDLLAVWEGKRMMEKDATLKLYHKLIENGRILSPVGHSNASFVFGEETGYPRVYIASSTDDPSKINGQELVQSLKQGKVIITNGPYLKFTVNGQGPGSLITDTDGTIEVGIEIFAPSWMDAYNFTIFQDGVFGKKVWFATEKVNGQRYPRPGSSKTGIFEFQINKDTVMTAIAGGRDSLEPVVSQVSFPENRGTHPFAIAGPIFIDFDGNGRYEPPPKPAP